MPANQLVSNAPGQVAGQPDAYARKAVLVSVAGYAMDGFDFLVLGVALSAISSSLALSPTEAGSLATITLWGAVLGGVIGGVLSDRWGRVRVLTYSILLFATFTFISGLAPSYDLLCVARFIAGMGLGAEFGIGMTLAAEAWPANRRARATSYVALGWQGGVLLANVAALWALSTPVIGWRGLFMLGAIPAVGAALLRRRVDEPQLFTDQQAATPARAGQATALFRGADHVRSSVALIVLTSVQNFGYYGVMIWLPSYLAHQFGFELTKSIIWTIVTVLGMGVGILAFGQLADRVGRRPSLLLFQAGAFLSVLAYSQLTNQYALLIGGAVMGAFVNGMLGGYGALMAELYPTEIRATAQNVLFNIGRGVGGFGPLVVGAVAAAHGFPLALTLLATTYLLAIIVTATLVKERKGAALT